MKKIRFLFIVFVFSIFWNCSNLEQDLEQEDISPEAQADIDPRLSLPYRILGYECDKFVFKFIRLIYDEDVMGRRLIKYFDYGHFGWINFIHRPDMPMGTMIYIGEGYICYNIDYDVDGIIEREPDYKIEQLVFHELFHIYQDSGVVVEKKLGAEMEAYLAQYFFCQKRSLEFSAISPEFGRYIGKMSEYFSNVGINDDKKFSAAYKKALYYLRQHSLYMGDDWIDDTSTYEFEKLKDLLN